MGPTREKVSDLFAAVDGDTYVGRLSVSFLSPASDAGAVALPRDWGAVLDQCRAPRSLLGHASEVSRGLTLDYNVVRTILDALVDKGLLRPFVQDASHAKASPVSVIAIPTSGRAAMLERALSSYARACAEHTREPRFIIADGSRSCDEEAANAAVVDAARKHTKCDLRVVGSAFRRRLRNNATKRGFPRAVVEWLLPDPPSVYAAGAVRNLVLLSSAGNHVLMADDDTICEPRTLAKCGSNSVSLVGHTDARETTWYASRGEAVSAGVPDPSDILSLHEAGLGKSLATLAASSPGNINVQVACAHLLRAITARPGGRVRATWMGIAGDGAAYCPHTALFAVDATRARMVASLDAFERALTSREVFRAVPHLTITDEPLFMTYCAAVENVDLLPPFNPTGFNEDGLFGFMLRVCDSSALIAQLPVAIVHDSARSGSYEPSAPRSATHVRVSDLVMWLTAPWMISSIPAPPAIRMARAGAYLNEIGSMASHEFVTRLKRTVLDARWALAHRCETLKQEAREWPYWYNALSKYQESLYSSLAKPGFFLPLEYRHMPAGEAIKATQHHVRMMGRSLLLWPELWSWCSEAHPCE